MKYRENIWLPSTESHTDRRPTYNGVLPGSPGGLFKTLLSLPQCQAAFSTIPSTLAWVDHSPLASMCRSNPHQGVPSTPDTASHITQGMDPCNPEIWMRGWVHGRLIYTKVTYKVFCINQRS